jgi:hypothetical protein
MGTRYEYHDPVPIPILHYEYDIFLFTYLYFSVNFIVNYTHFNWKILLMS